MSWFINAYVCALAHDLKYGGQESFNVYEMLYQIDIAEKYSSKNIETMAIMLNVRAD